MTPTDTDTLDVLTAKALLAAQGVPGKGQPVAPWESQPEAFQARMMEQARAVRLAHAKAGVQSVPVVATEGMLEAGENSSHNVLGHDEAVVVHVAMLEASPFYTEAQP